MCFCVFGCLCGRFFVISGVEKSGFVPYSDRKMQKVADFCGFAAIFGVFLVLKQCVI